MNKKGQVLVVFIAILPIIILLFAYIFDTAYMEGEKKSLDSVAKTSVEYLDKGYEINLVEKYIKDSDKKIIIKEIDSDNLSVVLEKKIDSYFGKILGLDEYLVKSSMKGKINNNKLLVEKR